MAIPNMMALLPIVLVLIVLRVMHRYLTRSPLDNLPSPSRGSWLLGNVRQVTDPLTAGKFTANLCETYGPAHRVHGTLGARLLHVFDPKALHAILVGEMEHFPKELAPLTALRLLLGPGILGTKGTQHRRQRRLLNAAFSQTNLREMTNILYDVANNLREAMVKQGRPEARELDINAWMAKTSLEILGNAFLGYSFNSFAEDSSDSLGESVKQFFAVVGKVPLIAFLVPWLSRFFPGSLIRRILLGFPWSSNLHRLFEISDTMRRCAMEIIELKKAALIRGDEECLRRVGEGKDIMSILLKSNMAASETDKIDDEELVAQVATIMLAGLDTTSNALSRILYVLARDHNAQERLRTELLAAQRRISLEPSESPSIPLDELMRLPYLDSVVRETLRLYSPVSFMSRRASKDIVLPLMWPVRGKDGSIISEIMVPKGTLVVANLQACNRNKALWGDDALEWRPERWLEELPRELYEAHVPGVYSNLMTFSAGGRSCIGVKFAEMEIKIVLSVMLTTFNFGQTDKPVVWKSAVVDYPTMGEESTKPELLLRVTPL